MRRWRDGGGPRRRKFRHLADGCERQPAHVPASMSASVVRQRGVVGRRERSDVLLRTQHSARRQPTCSCRRRTSKAMGIRGSSQSKYVGDPRGTAFGAALGRKIATGRAPRSTSPSAEQRPCLPGIRRHATSESPAAAPDVRRAGSPPQAVPAGGRSLEAELRVLDLPRDPPAAPALPHLNSRPCSGPRELPQRPPWAYAARASRWPPARARADARWPLTGSESASGQLDTRACCCPIGPRPARRNSRPVSRARTWDGRASEAGPTRAGTCTAALHRRWLAYSHLYVGQLAGARAFAKPGRAAAPTSRSAPRRTGCRAPRARWSADRTATAGTGVGRGRLAAARSDVGAMTGLMLRASSRGARTCSSSTPDAARARRSGSRRTGSKWQPRSWARVGVARPRATARAAGGGSTSRACSSVLRAAAARPGLARHAGKRTATT